MMETVAFLVMFVYISIITSWTQLGQDINGETSGDDHSGFVSLSSDGNIVAIGSRYNDANGSNSGNVRIYKNNNGTLVSNRSRYRWRSTQVIIVVILYHFHLMVIWSL